MLLTGSWCVPSNPIRQSFTMLAFCFLCGSVDELRFNDKAGCGICVGALFFKLNKFGKFHVIPKANLCYSKLK